jgi:hypothetical protein
VSEAVVRLLRMLALLHEELATELERSAQQPPLVKSPFPNRRTRDLIKAGKLRGTKQGRDYFVPPADLIALLDQPKREAPQTPEAIAAEVLAKAKMKAG